MKFDFKRRFCPKNSSACEAKHVVSLLGRVWRRASAPLFFLFLSVLAALGGYVWYRSLYRGAWSDEKKQQYLDSQDKGVVFREDDFEKVLRDIQARREENAEAPKPIKDIFQPYK